MSAKILIVEDQPEVAGLIKRRVEEIRHPEPFTVEIAGSVAEIPEKSGYAAVLLDLKLPNGMGMAVIHRTREKLPGSPIIVVTGFSEFTQEDIIDAGAESIIYKDAAVQPGVLENVIRLARARFRKRRELEMEWERIIHLNEELERVNAESKVCAKPETKRESIPKRATTK